jgi:hypothetical protein
MAENDELIARFEHGGGAVRVRHMCDLGAWYDEEADTYTSMGLELAAEFRAFAAAIRDAVKRGDQDDQFVLLQRHLDTEGVLLWDGDDVDRPTDQEPGDLVPVPRAPNRLPQLALRPMRIDIRQPRARARETRRRRSASSTRGSAGSPGRSSDDPERPPRPLGLGVDSSPVRTLARRPQRFNFATALAEGARA